jgi:hypothetical protein
MEGDKDHRSTPKLKKQNMRNGGNKRKQWSFNKGNLPDYLKAFREGTMSGIISQGVQLQEIRILEGVRAIYSTGENLQKTDNTRLSKKARHYRPKYNIIVRRLKQNWLG